MSFVIRVQATEWRTHQRQVRDAVAEAVSGPDRPGGIVPVAKGNGYGVGNRILARETTGLGCGTIAVGILREAFDALNDFSGDVLVLSPYEPSDPIAQALWRTMASHPQRHRLIVTAGSFAGLADLAVRSGRDVPTRVLLEGLTSMQRFGLSDAQIEAALSHPGVRRAIADGAIRIEGLALHLPMTQPAPQPSVGAGDPAQPGPVVLGTGRVQEAVSWALRWPALVGENPGIDDRAATLWTSHLTDTELRAVRGILPDVPINSRIGTRLWLGNRGALRAEGVVLAVHEQSGSRTAGYFQRELPRGGAVVVVGGGTSHGVALTPPRVTSSLRARAAAAGTGALEAAGRPRAPFHLPDAGQGWFHEPPHMHVSMLRLGRHDPRPEVGTFLPCDIRFTTANPDDVIFEG